jgi:SPP1 family predicted phage head-tail adaptor
MIDFGKYDRRVTLGNFQDTSDGYYGNTPVWVDEISTFASVQQLRGSNNIEQAQLNLPKTYLFRIMQREGLNPDPSMMIIYDGFYHKIQGIESSNERYKREFIITAVRNNLVEST